MANDKKNGSDTPAKHGPDTWLKVNTDRPLYKGDKGKGAPIQGVLLALLDMPPAKAGDGEAPKPWQAFVVRLTADCASVESRDGKTRGAKAGDEIIVPAGHQMRDAFGRAANARGVMFEVYAAPVGTKKNGMKELVLWDCRVNPTALPRDAAAKMLAWQGAAPAQLPSASDANEDAPPF